MLQLQGVMPALFTSYDDNGEVTTDGLEELLGFYIEAGCSGFFVGGSTGEGLLQTVEERSLYTDAVVRAVAGQVPVVAHVGALATRDACELARRAADSGADAVGSVLPVYYPVGTEATADYYRDIGEAAELPLLIYYLAKTASEQLDPQMFAETLAELPRVSALKYTSAELETFGQIIELTDHRLSMIMGCDQMLLPALTMGADGAIGSTYNFMPEISVGVYRHYHAGEMEQARELMERSFRMIHLMHRKYPMLAACKEVLRIRGYDTGPCRRPIPPMTDQQRRELRQDLEEEKFFTDPIT